MKNTHLVAIKEVFLVYFAGSSIFAGQACIICTDIFVCCKERRKEQCFFVTSGRLERQTQICCLK